MSGELKEAMDLVVGLRATLQNKHILPYHRKALEKQLRDLERLILKHHPEAWEELLQRKSKPIRSILQGMGGGRALEAWDELQRTKKAAQVAMKERLKGKKLILLEPAKDGKAKG